MSHIDPPIAEHFIAGKYVWDCLCHLILWPVMEYIVYVMEYIENSI